MASVEGDLDTEVEELLSGLPADAQVRLLRQRLSRAEAEVRKSAGQKRQLHRQLREAAEALRESAREREGASTALRRAEEERAQAEARAVKAAAAARAAQGVQRELGARLARRGGGSADAPAAAAGDGARLARAEAEIHRLREALGEARAAAGAVVAAAGGQGGPESAAVGALRARLKASERQRADLLGAFRKQMRLVELLKRQRAHIEAARLLGFTEESFAKALKLSGAPDAERIV